MSDKNRRAQKAAVEQILEDMLEWYASENGGLPPKHIAQDCKAYRGKTLYWLEPLLPGVDNPILIEESLGDYWTARLEKITDDIKIKL